MDFSFSLLSNCELFANLNIQMFMFLIILLFDKPVLFPCCYTIFKEHVNKQFEWVDLDILFM